MFEIVCFSGYSQMPKSAQKQGRNQVFDFVRNVKRPNFNNYEIGDHFGRSVTFRAKSFF
jgi:hypothetical protein